MKLTIKENTKEKVVIALQGDLDTAVVEKFTSELAPVLENASRQITMDFSGLEYISSGGMRVLLRVNKEAQLNGGKFVIVGMSEDIRQIFQMTGFDNMIEIQ